MTKATFQDIDPKSRIVIPQVVQTLEYFTCITKSIGGIKIENSMEIK